MLAINPKIKQKAEDIRKKIFGSEVRESLASGIEAISEDVEATIGRQGYVEEQFQNVIDETTGKDVISAPELIAARNGKSNLKTRLDEEHAQVTAQLQQTGKLLDVHKPELLHKNDKTSGFQFNKTNSAMIAHKDTYSIPPLTIDLLIGVGAETLDFTGVYELILASKSNSWVFKIGTDGIFYADVYKAGSGWSGSIPSKSPVNFQLVRETPIEPYGVSQGLTTDGAYLYTSNNRLDMNPYHIHKRKVNGPLIAGITLETGYTHPCGMCVVGSYLYVPANGFPNNVVNHKIFVIDTLEMQIVDEIPIVINSGGGISGLAYNNGYFYASDWQTSGDTNIFIYDKSFNLITVKKINTSKVQGIDISKNDLVAVSVNESSIITYDLATFVRKKTFPCYAEIELEDICVTEQGTILSGDVSTIREYQIADTPPMSEYNTEHYERLTMTIESVGGTVTYKLYRNGVYQSQTSFVGTVNNLTTYGLGLNGNVGGDKKSKFKLKAFGISNAIIVPTKNTKEIMDKNRYAALYVDGFLTTETIKDNSSSPSAIAVTGILENSGINAL